MAPTKAETKYNTQKDIVYFHYQWCIVDKYIYFVLYIYLTAAVTSFLYKLIFYI